MKIFQGTGTEEAYQPFSQFGYFTKTRALKPMGSVGGGMKYSSRAESVCGPNSATTSPLSPRS